MNTGGPNIMSFLGIQGVPYIYHEFSMNTGGPNIMSFLGIQGDHISWVF